MKKRPIVIPLTAISIAITVMAGVCSTNLPANSPLDRLHGLHSEARLYI